jgi:tetratricopeptide (TPR) repeat protein
MTALRLIDGLRSRYPHNPVLYLRLAQVQSDYLRNHAAALQTYRALFDAARGSRVAAPAIAEVNARLGMAREMDVLCETGAALEHLGAVIAQQPQAPYAALARAHYGMGLALDRSGRRSEAVTAYRNALASMPRDDRLRLGEQARAAIRRSPAQACR